MPLLVSSAAVALFSFAPWFAVCCQLARGRRPGKASAFGFVAGGIRTVAVCGPMLAVAPQPALAMILGFAYGGLLHSVHALVLAGLLRSDQWWRLALAGATVPALDALWCAPPSFRVPYMTSAYLAAGSEGMLRLAWLIGPVGLAACIGLGGIMLTQAWAVGGRARWSAALILLAVAVGDSLIPFRRFSQSAPKLTVVALPQCLNWVKATTRFQPLPDLVVMPEESVLAPKGVDDPEHLAIDVLSAQLRRMENPPVVLAGVQMFSGLIDRSYWNRVVLLDGKGFEVWIDKRNAAPGGEIAPLGDLPIIGRLLRKAAPVADTLLPPNPRTDGVVRVGRWSLAVAICYDHSIPYSRMAWGVDSSEQLDLLVCVAKTNGLGRARLWEEHLSERARRLHAAVFNCPLLYVSESGSSLIFPCGWTLKSKGGSAVLYAVPAN